MCVLVGSANESCVVLGPRHTHTHIHMGELRRVDGWHRTGFGGPTNQVYTVQPLIYSSITSFAIYYAYNHVHQIEAWSNPILSMHPSTYVHQVSRHCEHASCVVWPASPARVLLVLHAPPASR